MNKLNIINKVTYKCVDCGKERTTYPSYFKYLNGKDYRCFDCSMLYRSLFNKDWAINKYKSAQISGEKRILPRITYACIDCGKEKTGLPSAFNKPREEYRCHTCNIKKRSENEDWKINLRFAAQKRFEDPMYKKKLSESAKKRCEDPEHKAAFKKFISNPDLRKKANEKIKIRRENPDFIEKQTGEGFWYGHHLLSGKERTYYCELWNRDLWNRIDAAWDYKSTISGKTRFENYNGCHLDRHHVYWQKKACCEWDEDIGGYYAWINNNGKKVKYYINGDPNKFVLLTKSEHGMIKGNKKSGKDRIYWIKYFENLIEQREKEGKKCYLSKEEYEGYRIEHKDVIEKYKKY
jgi:DNA-directed RNA polymerase subunit RPC12/RpoP